MMLHVARTSARWVMLGGIGLVRIGALALTVATSDPDSGQRGGG
jgi:hypothetical protein